MQVAVRGFLHGQLSQDSVSFFPLRFFSYFQILLHAESLHCGGPAARVTPLTALSDDDSKLHVGLPLGDGRVSTSQTRSYLTSGRNWLNALKGGSAAKGLAESPTEEHTSPVHRTDESSKGVNLDDEVKRNRVDLAKVLGQQALPKWTEPVLAVYRKAIGAETQDGTGMHLFEIAASLQATTKGLSLAEIIYGLYVLSLRHAADGTQDVIPGKQVLESAVVEDLLYHCELARGAYAKDALGLARASMLREEKVLKFVPKASALRPAYYIAVDEKRGLVVLGIRGTAEAGDVLTSLATRGEPFPGGGFSHGGMLRAALWFLKNEVATLKQCLTDHPGYKVRLVGHSLGGGTAALLTLLLRQDPSHLGVPADAISAVCFATPACLSLREAEQARDAITTVVHQDDVIPRISTASLQQLRAEISQAEGASLLGQGAAWKEALERLTKGLESLPPSLRQAAVRYSPRALLAERKGVISLLTREQEQAEEIQAGSPGPAHMKVVYKRTVQEVPLASGQLRGNVQGISVASTETEDDKRWLANQTQSTGQREREQHTLPGLHAMQPSVSDQEGNASLELVTPGRVFHLRHRDWPSTTGGSSDAKFMLIEGVSRAVPRRLVLSSSCLMDHKCRYHWYTLREVLKVL